MTIVTWDGKHLSADSKRSTYAVDKLTGERRKLREATDILKIIITADEATVAVPEKQLIFRDQVVLAVARCGSVKTTTLMIETLLAKKDLVKVFVRKFKNGRLENYKVGNLFILTDTSSWHCRFSPIKGFTHTEIGANKFAMGADARTGRFLMRYLNLDSAHAAMGVTMMTKKCGGDINSVMRHPTLPIAVQTFALPTTSPKSVKTLLRQHVAFDVIQEGKRADARAQRINEAEERKKKKAE